jgi:hypothetical protein
MRQILFLVISGSLLVGCASKPSSPEEASVRILKKSDPPATCKELGKVIASGLASLSDEGREQDLKKATYKLSGDTVTWDKQDENRTIYGTAYKCN